MSTSTYVLAAAVLASGAGIIAALRHYTRIAIAAAQQMQQSLAAALQNHQSTIAKSLQSNNTALETFAEAIPSGATIFAHKVDTSGATKLEPSHSVEFK